jgi:hypothetical protein
VNACHLFHDNPAIPSRCGHGGCVDFKLNESVRCGQE